MRWLRWLGSASQVKGLVSVDWGRYCSMPCTWVYRGNSMLLFASKTRKRRSDQLPYFRLSPDLANLVAMRKKGGGRGDCFPEPTSQRFYFYF